MVARLDLGLPFGETGMARSTITTRGMHGIIDGKLGGRIGVRTCVETRELGRSLHTVLVHAQPQVIFFVTTATGGNARMNLCRGGCRRQETAPGRGIGRHQNRWHAAEMAVLTDLRAWNMCRAAGRRAGVGHFDDVGDTLESGHR